MSHVSWPSTADSSESDSKWDGQSAADIDHISIPGPDASKGDLLEVIKSIPDACDNEIKKLWGVAGDIFNLPSKYFTNTSYDRANIHKIQQLLGVTSLTNLAYKTFPLTVYGNWLLLAQRNPQILKASLYGITSLHYTSSGRGTHTNSMKWSIGQVMLGCITWTAVLAIFLLSSDTEFLSMDIGKSCMTFGLGFCSLDMESSDDGTETMADVTGLGTPTGAALERHVNALDAAAATAKADEVGAAVISSSGEVLQEAADDLRNTRGRSKKSKRGRKVTMVAMATDRTTWQAHK
ncbi:hypothetical protein BDR06DRAFT_976389 [Suillus hirtellus]|nr:hypothetical protein BDR06DRAFT_976389 [Suillus hirtellus]